MAQSEYSISALEAALDVAESFLTPNGTIRGVSEISRQTGLHKNRVFRILSTLSNRGYIEQDQVTQKYRLGSGFLVLGEATGAQRGRRAKDTAGISTGTRAIEFAT
jgi:DNA-binding IclR family transcriptional regulator